MRRGFTMIEVMVAGAILAIGCLGILAMLLTTINYNRETHLRTQAVTLAEQQVSEFQAASINWTATNTPTPITFLKQCTVNTWCHLNVVNVNGSKIENVNAPPAQFAVGYNLIVNNDTEVRGSMRVIWNRKTNGCYSEEALSANSFVQTDTVSQHSNACGFISIPFALKRDLYAVLNE